MHQRLQQLTVESVDGDVLIIDGKDTSLIDFDTTPQSISKMVQVQQLQRY